MQVIDEVRLVQHGDESLCRSQRVGERLRLMRTSGPKESFFARQSGCGGEAGASRRTCLIEIGCDCGGRIMNGDKRVLQVFVCMMGLLILSSPALGADSVESFLGDPVVSLLGWLVSFLAGVIAIFEFVKKRNVKRELKSKEVAYNKLEARFNNLQFEYNQLKVSYDRVSVSGKGTYARENSGVINIDNRDG